MLHFANISSYKLHPISFRHITLRSRSKGCYLTSSVKNYEALYKDGRRSSQQQVCRDKYNTNAIQDSFEVIIVLIYRL